MSEKQGVYITRVIDGDTFVGDVPFMVLGHMFMMYGETFRMEGINAPEPRGEEREQGLISKEFVTNLLEGKTVVVETDRRDSFGRWIVKVHLDGVVINDYLVEEGYAEYKNY